ncbi:MAG: MMPL family transporter, partial [Planctomycetaceae bacterium]
MPDSPPTTTPDLHRRRFRLLLVYGLLSLPVVLLGARAALRVNANSPLAWVPETFPARAQFDRFRSMFGSGDVAIVGWEGGTVDDPRINRFTKLLRKSPTFRLDDGTPVFEQVISGVEAYDRLLRPPIDLDEQEAARRLRGSLLGPDGVSTCVVVVFEPRALPDRARWITLIRATATRHCDVPAEELHLAGPVLDGLEVDCESQASLDRFALPSALAVLGMCLLFLPTWRAAAVVFLLSVFCELATLALVHYCGDSLNALLIVLPPLIQTAAVSGGIHLVNYYFDSHAGGHRDPAGRAMRLAWLPCALSAGTTAIGLASLMVSELAPIRAFGAFGGAGMVLTTALLLTVIPGLFTLWPHALLKGWKRPAPRLFPAAAVAELSSGQTAGPGPGTADVAGQTVAVGPVCAARSEGEPGGPGE